MGRFFKIYLSVALLFSSVTSFCCTSVIISGKVRSDGRPLMLKHRDTGELNNRIQWFHGPVYSFTGVVNSPSVSGEVWTGINSAGFSIMNTATYDLKDDDIPQSEMDMEGAMMYDVLGKCGSVNDFQNYLDTLHKPWRVEANFGVIDAFGEAAYFEVNNHEYTRFDVADEPGGYMVVTNFTRTGRKEDRRGVDRWEKACDIMKGIDAGTTGHEEIFNKISRSYSPILREITSCSIVIEGVPEGTDPSVSVMWTICGCPSNCFYIPLMERGYDNIPCFLKRTSENENCELCDKSLELKNIFGIEPGCVEECRKIEKYIDKKFSADMSRKRYLNIISKAYSKFDVIYSRNVTH